MKDYDDFPPPPYQQGINEENGDDLSTPTLTTILPPAPSYHRFYGAYLSAMEQIFISGYTGGLDDNCYFDRLFTYEPEKSPYSFFFCAALINDESDEDDIELQEGTWNEEGQERLAGFFEDIDQVIQENYLQLRTISTKTGFLLQGSNPHELMKLLREFIAYFEMYTLDDDLAPEKKTGGKDIKTLAVEFQALAKKDFGIEGDSITQETIDPLFIPAKPFMSRDHAYVAYNQTAQSEMVPFSVAQLDYLLNEEAGTLWKPVPGLLRQH